MGDKGGGLTVLSFGGGQDSTALLYLYANDASFRRRYAPGRFLVLMSDTGDEHPETYAHVARVRDFCRGRGIEFHLITPEQGCHSPNWQSLTGFYRRTSTCGSKAFRKSCTDRLKIGPFYRFLESWVTREYGLGTEVEGARQTGRPALRAFAAMHGRIRIMIGIAASEESRLSKDEDPVAWRRAACERIYPLIDLRMDRAACQAYIRHVGEVVPPPSNCMICPYLSEVELLWLARFHPAKFEEWVEIEKAKLAKFSHLSPDKNLGVFGRRDLRAALARATERHGHLTDAQLQEHKMSHAHCVKSRY